LAVGGLRVLLGHRFEIGDSVLFDSSHQEIDLKQECLYGSYFSQQKSTKRLFANDAPSRSEKIAKIQRTVALEGRDVRLSAASFADFQLFFHSPFDSAQGSAERCPPFALACAPDPVKGFRTRFGLGS
jgi:hypothetical protein